jgi:hypothetical protein
MEIARLFAVALVLLAVPTPGFAHGPNGHPADPNLHVDDSSYEECFVQFAPELTQGAFRRFAREFGSVSAFKQMAPPTSLGQWGISAGVEYMWFPLEDKSDAWNDTFAHPDAYHELGDTQAFPKLKLAVGITEDLDVGAFFTKNLWANYGWIGLEAKYGLLKQGAEMPISLALRGAYTKTLFVADMDMHALTADVTAGRTFWDFFTPYLGVGTNFVLARETSPVVELQTEAPVVPHALAGLELRVWHLAFGVEAELGALPSAQMQVAAVF